MGYIAKGDGYENEELNQKADSVRNHEKTKTKVKEYEAIIKAQKKHILNAAYRLGSVFKRFQESHKFTDMVKEPWVSKSAIYFKINLTKIMNKYPKIKKVIYVINFFKKLCKYYKEDMLRKWELV